jgi:hypothetical protein
VKHRRSFARASALSLAVALLAVGCSTNPGSTGVDPTPTVSTPEQSASPSQPTVKKVDVVAVGDIACDPTSPVFDDPQYCQHEQVARLTHKLVRQGAKYFMPLGDIQYESGSYDAFMQVYDKYFGDLKPITEPVLGNHEYYTEGASGYFKYFGKRAGTPDKPWSSFSPMPGWRVYLLDSNCEYIGGCGPKSPEGKWLAKELKKSSETCAIAAWHHPLHTSGGYNGDQATIDRALPLWTAVDAGGVDIVLNGHDHIYDRFAPIGGVTEFVVGTGGKELYEIGPPAPKSKVAFDDRTGVLRLTLRSDQRFDYSFIDASNDKVVDSGSQRCINNPSH